MSRFRDGSNHGRGSYYLPKRSRSSIFPELENAVDVLNHLMKEREPHERLTRSSSLPHDTSFNYGTHASFESARNMLKTKSMIEADDSSWDGSESSRDSSISRESNAG